MSRISFSSGFLWVFYLLKHAHLICDWTKRCCGSQWPHPCSSDLRQWNPAKHARSPPHLQMLPHHKGMLQKELLACLFATDALTVHWLPTASVEVLAHADFTFHPEWVYIPLNLVVSNWIVSTSVFEIKYMIRQWLYSNLTSLANLFLNYQELKFTQ